WPDHLPGADGRMPMNSEMPITGRLRSVAFGFLSSTCGWPVTASIGSFSQTTTPQMPLPHFVTLTRASPFSVSQTPTGSALWANAGAAPSSVAASAKTKPNRAMKPLLKTGASIATMADSAMVDAITLARLLAPARQSDRQHGAEPE